MTSKLTIANGALRLLGERSLSQNELTNGTREPARLFNTIWADGGLNAVLEAGMWKFAKRTVQLDTTPSVTATFGYEYAFEKPSDFVRTIGVWEDEMLTTPFIEYREEGGYWFGTRETMYVAYVSNDTAYGLDYSLWPQSFVKFVQAHFAAEMAGPVSDKAPELKKVRKDALTEALSRDAMADPTRVLPAGSWSRARWGGSMTREGGRGT